MKTNSTQQEILLVTGTSFLTREFCENSEAVNSNHLTEKEKLKMACWNGLLPDMLPEIFEQRSVNKLYLREMSEDSLFIELKSGEIFLEMEIQFSIDPVFILAMQILS